MNELINHKGVCRTAPSLLITYRNDPVWAEWVAITLTGSKANLHIELPHEASTWASLHAKVQGKSLMSKSEIFMIKYERTQGKWT